MKRYLIEVHEIDEKFEEVDEKVNTNELVDIWADEARLRLNRDMGKR
jgi:hypothetical protein